ncbi:MAG: hypothetical protein ACWA5U_09170 [bacterium]
MLDFLLELLKDDIPWLLLILAAPLYLWGKMIHDSLNSSETHPESFQRVIRWLRDGTFGEIYLRWLRRALAAVADFIGDRDQFDVGTQTGRIGAYFGVNPFSPQAYEWCLRLAFLYPILTLLIAWAYTGQIYIGEEVLIDTTNLLKNTSQRTVTLSLILCMLLLIVWGIFRWGTILQQWVATTTIFFLLVTAFGLFTNRVIEVFILSFRILIGFLVLPYIVGILVNWLYQHSFTLAHKIIFPSLFAFTFAFTFATFDISFNADTVIASKAMIIASIMALAIAVAVVVAGAGALAGVIAGVIFGSVFSSSLDDIAIAINTGIFIASVLILQSILIQRQLLASFWWFYSILLVIVIYSIIFLSSISNLIIILFWFLLPILNAFLDWLSLSITRGLLHAVSHSHHSGFVALLWILLDLLLAFILLLLMIAGLLITIQLASLAANQELIDIDWLLFEMEIQPFAPQHGWIYFMLFSTLIPTLLHFSLVGGAVMVSIPRATRHWLATNLTQDHHRIGLAWLYLTFMPVLGFILFPLGLLIGLYFLLTGHGSHFGELLLMWARLWVW